MASADLAFLVLSGGDTVGVVLARRTGVPGEAQIVLDYVLPHYRDFTPGEFVYRRGGPFAAAGVHRVLAPADMRDADRYLASVGFRSSARGPGSRSEARSDGHGRRPRGAATAAPPG